MIVKIPLLIEKERSGIYVPIPFSSDWEFKINPGGLKIIIEEEKEEFNKDKIKEKIIEEKIIERIELLTEHIHNGLTFPSNNIELEVDTEKEIKITYPKTVKKDRKYEFQEKYTTIVPLSDSDKNKKEINIPLILENEEQERKEKYIRIKGIKKEKIIQKIYTKKKTTEETKDNLLKLIIDPKSMYVEIPIYDEKKDKKGRILIGTIEKSPEVVLRTKIKEYLMMHKIKGCNDNITNNKHSVWIGTNEGKIIVEDKEKRYRFSTKTEYIEIPLEEKMSLVLGKDKNTIYSIRRR